MRNALKLHEEKGYTLLESILQLLIMISFIQLFVIFFYWKSPIENYYSDYKMTEWELFSADIQTIISEVNDLTLLTNGFSITKNNTRYHINQNGSVIRQQTNGEGHIPLFTGVKKAEFTFDGVFLSLQVIMQDGSSKERSFAVGLAAE